jgi:hypothetical protein
MSDLTTNIPNDSRVISRDITRDITQDTSKNMIIKDKKSTTIVLKAVDLNIRRIAERINLISDEETDKFPPFA